jgi:hypothetical protein
MSDLTRTLREMIAADVIAHETAVMILAENFALTVLGARDVLDRWFHTV